MGPDSRDPQGLGNLVFFPGSHYADPRFSWFNPVGPTALVFLNSARLGVEYQNDLFVGDINNGNLYRLRVNATRNGFDFNSLGLSDLVADSNAEFQEVLLGTGFGGITDLKIGPDGLLYVLSFGLGKIFVISGRQSPVDFDGDGKSDIGVYRDGTWFILRSSDSGVTAGLGRIAQDVPVPADYDGDGKTDIAVYRNGDWYIIRSGDGGLTAVGWGIRAGHAVRETTMATVGQISRCTAMASGLSFGPRMVVLQSNRLGRTSPKTYQYPRITMGTGRLT